MRRPRPAAWARPLVPPRSTRAWSISSTPITPTTGSGQLRHPTRRQPPLFSGRFTYTRPGTTYIALRQILGKDNFAAALQQTQRDYRHSSITEKQLEAEFQAFLPNQSAACHARLDEFFTQWFDTVYPPGGGANRPQLTGPGLSGPGFYNPDGTCG